MAVWDHAVYYLLSGLGLWDHVVLLTTGGVGSCRLIHYWECGIMQLCHV